MSDAIDTLIEDVKCDDCGNPHSEEELVMHFGTAYLICVQCIGEYKKIWKK